MGAPSPAGSAGSGSSESDNESHDANQQNKGPAQKDKECQYCHQKFTSSSLGRHLDQYIKKKKPDGIHNVDEIRRLRGSITRRTARNSKKQDHSQNARGTSSSARPSPAPTAQSAFPEPAVDRLNSYVPGSIHSSINRMNWHSTGVITDPTTINPTPSTTHTPITITGAPVTGSPTKKRSFSAYASDLPVTSHTTSSTSPSALADTARALELSLREVLDSLRAASKHINTPPTPFEFDIQAQTYPSLVLKLLPPPPTLMQVAPFATAQSVPLHAPGADQLVPLRNRLTWTIDRWKWNALRLAQRTTSNIADEASFLSSQADTYTSSALTHLNASFENWMAQPPEARDALWHIELLRAFQSSKDKATEMEERMDELAQERNQLKQQVDYLSRCQWPREMALWPPDRLTYGKKMREEIRLVNLQRPAGAVLRGQGGAPAAGLVPAGLNRARSEGAGPEDLAGGAAGGYGGAGGASGVETTDDEEDNPNMVTENVNTRGDKWDLDKLVGKWKSYVKEDRLRRAPWTTQAQAGVNGVGAASGSPVDGMVGRAPGSTHLHAATNGADGSPGLSGTNGTGEGEGLGIRRDKKPYGKDNNVTIISDW